MKAPLGKIAVVGSGAIGCHYGAHLVRSGRDVHFLLRRELERVRRDGLRVRVLNRAFLLPKVQAAATTAEIGPSDLVIVALKGTANEALLELLPPLLHERTAILTLQNGLGGDEWLARHFGAERVLGGLCFICVNRLASGEIVCTEPGSLALGEFGRPAGERVQAIAAMFREAGVRTTVGDDLANLRWHKLVWNIPFNGLSIAAGGKTTDEILADPALEHEVRDLMREVADAAGRLGHRISDKFVHDQVERTRPMGAYRTSSLIDFQEGREVEIEPIWGEPLRRALAAGATVPRLQHLYDELCRLTRSRPA